MKKKTPEYIKDVRKLLQKLAKKKLGSMMLMNQVVKQTSISKSSLEAMIYRGEGGLDSWVELLTFLYQIDPIQLLSCLEKKF